MRAASHSARSRRSVAPSIATTGISSGASRCRRSVASSAASESLSIRSARARGWRRAASTASARPTRGPACGPPSSLSPEKTTSAAPAATDRRTDAARRDRGERAGADVVDHGHAELAQRLDPDVLDEPALHEVRAVHAQHRARVRRDRALVVADPRAVRRAHLDQPRAGLRDHVRHPEPAADLHQLPARDDDLAPAQRRHGQQRRARAVVDREPRLRARQLPQQRLDVGVPGAALAVLPLEVRVARRDPRDRLLRGRRRAARGRGWCGR